MTSAAPPPADAAAAMSKRAALEVVLYWGIVVAWMTVISLLSTEPFSAQNTHRYIDPVLRYFFPHLTQNQFLAAHNVIRKTAHLTEFFILGCLVFWAARRGRQPRWRGAWMAQALGVAVLYALLDEAHQAFVINRTASLIDSGIDSLGAAASQLWIYTRHQLRARAAASR